jgi:outer membrane protein TolC
MKQLALQAEQLAQMVKMQQFANIPSLAVAFNYSYNAMANDFKFNDYRWTPYSFVALQLSIPIFAGGKRHNDIRQARNQHAQMQYQIENTERQLKIAIRNSLTTMETNMKTYYSAEEAVALAQKSYDVVSKSYEVGRATILDLNDAQLALTQARLGQSQAIYNFVIAKAQLEQTLGADFVNE